MVEKAAARPARGERAACLAELTLDVKRAREKAATYREILQAVADGLWDGGDIAGHDALEQYIREAETPSAQNLIREAR